MNEPSGYQTAFSQGDSESPPPYWPPPTQGPPRPPTQGPPRPRNPKPSWLKYSATAIVALLVGFVAAASDTTAEQELATAKTENQQALDVMEDEVASLEEQLSLRDDQIDEAEFRAEEAEDMVDKALDRVNEREADLDKRERELDGREDEIQVVENDINRNTINDGIWQVGTDFDAGTYRSQGGGLCYWARLGSADNYDIISNGLGKNQTVTLNAGEWFETDGCGEWTPLG